MFQTTGGYNTVGGVVISIITSNIKKISSFQVDCGQFVNEYHENGPMQPGLTPREASDRLQMFQNHFDALWRKHSSYTIGEDLFGLPHSEQPELNKIKKELNLLQRLYKLYNDVIDRCV